VELIQWHTALSEIRKVSCYLRISHNVDDLSTKASTNFKQNTLRSGEVCFLVHAGSRKASLQLLWTTNSFRKQMCYALCERCMFASELKARWAFCCLRMFIPDHVFMLMWQKHKSNHSNQNCTSSPGMRDKCKES